MSRLNPAYPVLVAAFVVYNIVAYLIFVVFVLNTWTGKVPAPKILNGTKLPKVGIIVPTWREPVEMVQATLLSILHQNYPQEKMVIVVSDDAANHQMQQMTVSLARSYPNTEFIYTIPAEKGSPERNGEGKAGNLNSALLLIEGRADIQFIETRDADDLVGHPDFLRHVLGQLISDPKLAFVQTTKSVFTDKNDRFGNREDFFYRSVMLYKNGANAVFPCGSGLVWSKTALLDIGRFPAWNLVEDFQSGAEALKRSWKGIYLPFIGAIGQVAPDDIPNVYKQRGTWALDSLRFMFWGNKQGLNVRQRLHYFDSALLYIFSSVTFLYSFVLAIWLIIGDSPVTANTVETTIYHFTWLLTFFVFLKALAYKGDVPISSVLRGMQNMFSLAPIYIIAIVKALIYGPNRKPKYKVTRKYTKQGLHVLQVLPQLILTIFLCVAIGMHIRLYISSENIFDLVNIAWAGMFIVVFMRPITNAFHGFNFGKAQSLAQPQVIYQQYEQENTELRKLIEG